MRRRSARRWTLVLVFLPALWSNPSAARQNQTPRRPPEPFRVFIHASDPAEATLRAELKEVLPAVRERMQRRGSWFLLTDSVESADLILRVVNYRTGSLRGVSSRLPPFTTVGILRVGSGARDSDYHFIDAVVRSGEIRKEISGLHTGPGRGDVLRGAASHLAEELERFAKDNYGAFRQLRERATPR